MCEYLEARASLQLVAVLSLQLRRLSDFRSKLVLKRERNTFLTGRSSFAVTPLTTNPACQGGRQNTWSPARPQCHSHISPVAHGTKIVFLHTNRNRANLWPLTHEYHKLWTVYELRLSSSFAIWWKNGSLSAEKSTFAGGTEGYYSCDLELLPCSVFPSWLLSWLFFPPISDSRYFPSGRLSRHYRKSSMVKKNVQLLSLHHMCLFIIIS